MDLENGDGTDPGDWVGVVTHWTMPGLFDGMTTADLARVQDPIASGQWAQNVQGLELGRHAVAEALGLDISDKAIQQRVRAT